VDELKTLARSSGSQGEVVLRRREHEDGFVDELIVNGTFAMDSAETSSEEDLAELVLEHAAEGARVLIGGLGLGYTARATLARHVGAVEVVELEEALVHWARQGVTANLTRVATDPRCTLLVGDIADVLTGSHATASGPWDAIALDVDNGPDFLIHQRNEALYAPGLLARAYERLAPGGRLAIWCQGRSPALLDSLSRISPSATQHLFQVCRGQRSFAYAIYTVDRPLTSPAPPG
jgi:spermidine synthase